MIPPFEILTLFSSTNTLQKITYRAYTCINNNTKLDESINSLQEKTEKRKVRLCSIAISFFLLYFTSHPASILLPMLLMPIQCFLCQLSDMTLQPVSMPLHQQYFWPSALHQTSILDRRVQLASSNTLTHSTDGNKHLDLPLIPHFSIVSLTPHGNLNLRVRRDSKRSLSSSQH
jgi:hypothetical protein